MTIELTIRPAERRDIAAIQSVAENAELFPPEMLEDMMSGYLDRTSNDLWLVAVTANRLVGFGFCEPERMTSGTWNLLAIGILDDCRGRGIGAEMMRHLEDRLRAAGERILIVETLGTPVFERTRSFYRMNGYMEEARIREFYEPGGGKVVYCKHL